MSLTMRLNNLAELYRAQGQYGKAEPLYQRALATYEKFVHMNTTHSQYKKEKSR